MHDSNEDSLLFPDQVREHLYYHYFHCRATYQYTVWYANLMADSDEYPSVQVSREKKLIECVNVMRDFKIRCYLCRIVLRLWCSLLGHSTDSKRARITKSSYIYLKLLQERCCDAVGSSHDCLLYELVAYTLYTILVLRLGVVKTRLRFHPEIYLIHEVTTELWFGLASSDVCCDPTALEPIHTHRSIIVRLSYLFNHYCCTNSRGWVSA